MGKKKGFYKWLAFFICITTISFLSAAPSQVLIIPNAEISGNGELSQTGLERAGALAPYFTMTSDLLLFGYPAAFFASKPIFSGIENTVCAVQTVAPTAQSLLLPVHSPYGPGQEVLLANFILTDPRYQGQNIVIAWQRTALPALVQAFGYDEPSVPPTSNFTYILTFPITSPTATRVNQDLLFGD